MSTTIRPEVSPRHPYRLDRHRYYELKHFCLQFPGWRENYISLGGIKSSGNFHPIRFSTGAFGRPTEDMAEARIFYSDRMDLLRRAALETDPLFGDYILEAVTEGLSYDTMRARYNIPFGKDLWYSLYRRFFWVLSKERQ